MKPYYKQYIITINTRFINLKKMEPVGIPDHQRKKH